MVVPNSLLFSLMTILDSLLFISFAKKSNVFAIFQAYKTFVENQIGKKIKMLSIMIMVVNLHLELLMHFVNYIEFFFNLQIFIHHKKGNF
jgi:hypothetical protein